MAGILRGTALQLSEANFDRLSQLISTFCGIKMPPNKKAMLQSRLQKRLGQLAMKSMSDYCDYLFSSEGMINELSCMIDAVTTNKTDFFREPAHFEYLTENVLPEILGAQEAAAGRSLKLFSAGCSTGEEPYSLAMVLDDLALKKGGFDFTILATDISKSVLQKARSGIYPAARSGSIPIDLRKRYLLRSKDRSASQIRIIPRLRAKVSFRQLNLMLEDHRIKDMFDVIFIRNVLIYFHRQTQMNIINRLCAYLNRGGFIFVGHSETLHGLGLPLEQMVPTVYRKLNEN